MTSRAGVRWLAVCAVNSWRGTARTDRHIAEQLARYAKVLWVEPPRSVITRAHHRDGEPRSWRPRIVAESDRVTRLVTVAQPLFTRTGVRVATAPLVRAQIRWALRELDARPAAVLTFAPDGMLGGWGEDVIDVFYCTDDYLAGAALMGLSPRAVASAESRALAHADLVFAVSEVLCDKLRDRGVRPLLVPAGVHTQVYEQVETATVPADADLPHPVAGVIGHLSERIDMDLLEATVDAGVSLLLIGLRDQHWQPRRFAALAAHPRVRWLGHRPFESLPSYLRIIDVGLTPYRDIEFNRASFPLKTLEYLAAGRPAVSTDLPAVRWLDTDLIRTAKDPVAFAAAVRQEAELPRTDDLVRRRREFAQRHSWQSRGEVVATAIGLA